VFPALVVYERSGGPVTAANRAKVAADLRRFATARDVTARSSARSPLNRASSVSIRQESR
jgi:hypothetical protein